MMDRQRDPMEPPRFALRKAPPRPPSPPAPVLHSPERRAARGGERATTGQEEHVEEEDKWKIAPCVSHWKNRMGYTVALEHRLAASGAKGTAVEEARERFNGKRFEEMTRVLYETEKREREAVERRAKVAHEVKMEEKKRREQQLRDLAEEARAGRGAGGAIKPNGVGLEVARMEKSRAGARGEVDVDVDARVYDRAERGAGNGEAGGGDGDSYSVYDTPLFAAGASNIYAPKASTAIGVGVVAGGSFSTSAQAHNRSKRPHPSSTAAATHDHHTFQPVEFERAPAPRSEPKKSRTSGANDNTNDGLGTNSIISRAAQHASEHANIH
mmetsp:Transcript_7854/g.16831  ORF Transcript_7854/g.16831 Transcript_7854/m.16831 type:complete len:327 (-) Transcript_7854:170-1150(-)